ncbi:MAG: hypothetical protein MZW92_58660 [Comamonadaceae bacterium]|nr:hypothetical protein [Comamonadaceae bacterium]
MRPDWLHAHYLTSHGTLAWLAHAAAAACRAGWSGSAWGSDVLVTPQRSALLRCAHASRAARLRAEHQRLAGTWPQRMRELGAGEVMVLPVRPGDAAAAAGGRHKQDARCSSPTAGWSRSTTPQRVLRRLRRASPWPGRRRGWWWPTTARCAPRCSNRRPRPAGAARALRRPARRRHAGAAATPVRAGTSACRSSDSVAVSVLEAMAHGCIPLLSDLPANRELVRGGDNGLVLAQGDELPDRRATAAAAGPRRRPIAACQPRLGARSTRCSRLRGAASSIGCARRMPKRADHEHPATSTTTPGRPALGMEYRPYYLAREWVRAGHRVQIVGGRLLARARAPAAAGDQAVDGIAYRWLRHAALPGQRPGPGAEHLARSCAACGPTRRGWCASSGPTS